MNQQDALKSLDIIDAESVKLRAYLKTTAAPVDPLGKYSLTICANAAGVLSGKGDALKMNYPDWTDPAKFPANTNQYFSAVTRADGKKAFKMLSPGRDLHPAKTSNNTEDGRTEFLDEERFGPAQSRRSDDFLTTITDIAPKGKGIFGQLHRGSTAPKGPDDPFKLCASDQGPGKGLLIRALVKVKQGDSDTIITFKFSPKVGEEFAWYLDYKADDPKNPVPGRTGILTIFIGGETHSIAVDLTGADASYFKAGAYNNTLVGAFGVILVIIPFKLAAS